jgi:hypothetical protein
MDKQISCNQQQKMSCKFISELSITDKRLTNSKQDMPTESLLSAVGKGVIGQWSYMIQYYNPN